MSAILSLLFLVMVVGIFRPYKFIPQGKRWHYAVAAFGVLLLIGMTAPQNVNGTGKSAATSENSSSDGEIEQVNNEETSEWNYDEQKDEMRGSVDRFAELDGENTIHLDFPYGEQRGKILIRDSAKFGFDILVGVPSGQIMCNTYSNSYINVKFDDGPIERFGCVDASDGTNNMVFVEEENNFLSKLRKSERVVIEAEFFQNGMQQMKFNSKGLNWE